MMNPTKSVFLGLLLAFGLSGSAWAHCQIPCGIFDDDKVFTGMLEDVTTIKKSMRLIDEESAKAKPNYNQLVRWVMNKETHADKISQTVLTYFLAQRVKPTQDDYQKKLVSLHTIITLAMKAKQSTDQELCDKLEAEIQTFHKMYHKH